MCLEQISQLPGTPTCKSLSSHKLTIQKRLTLATPKTMAPTRNRGRRQRNWEQEAAAAGIHVPIGADAGKYVRRAVWP